MSLEGAERQRVAALRAQSQFFWLDVSLSETSRDDLNFGWITDRVETRSRFGCSGSSSRSRQGHCLSASWCVRLAWAGG
jgi:hypothetical protein